MLADNGNKKAALIQKLSENSTGFLSTIQVAITFAGFFSSASAATGISQILGNRMAQSGIPYSQSIAMVVVTIILSYFNLVFGELVPKLSLIHIYNCHFCPCEKCIHHGKGY